MGENSAPQEHSKDTSQARSSTSGLAKILAALVVLGSLALVVSLGMFVWSTYQEREARSAYAVQLDKESRYVDFGEKVITLLMVVNLDTLEDDVEKINSHISGDFASDFTTRQESYIEVVKDVGIETDGTVLAGAIEEISGNKASILYAVNQIVKGKDEKKERDIFYRLRLTVEEDSAGELTVSRWDLVP